MEVKIAASCHSHQALLLNVTRVTSDSPHTQDIVYFHEKPTVLCLSFVITYSSFYLLKLVLCLPTIVILEDTTPSAVS